MVGSSLLLLLVASFSGSQMNQMEVLLKPGMVIRASCTIKAGSFLFPNKEEKGETGAISILGDNITVDFQGTEIMGSPKTTEPDKRIGTGLFIKGKNVTVKNVTIRGYKQGIVARYSNGLKLVNCDLSYNWKQHLLSTEEKEDGADWMSYHHNEKDEWLGYGAAIYLRDCNNFEVKGCRATGGQNALMMTNCNQGLVWNNDFSFNSSLGIGMYRSSKNQIMHNKVDWCVRGYSHGVYNRGQDSAGILIYEQSNNNVFAYNSVTHGGDGFFLWAGQTTMDNGKGGCNDNLLYGNDWSHAPTNGIEATFSRNTFANNLIMECWHGIWGGYSYETQVVGNYFAYNAEAVAWEHGQDNSFVGNTFFRDNTILNIWQNASQDPNWGYPKNRDTRSRDYRVEGNLFAETPGFAVSLRDTLNFKVGTNQYSNLKGMFDLRGNVAGYFHPEIVLHKFKNFARPTNRAIHFEETIFRTGPYPISSVIGHISINGLGTDLPSIIQPSGNLMLPYPDGDLGYSNRFRTNWNPLKNGVGQRIAIGTLPAGRNLPAVPKEALNLAPKPLSGGIDPFFVSGSRRGRKYILVDEWGPYDFKRPIVARAKLCKELSNSKIQSYEGEIWGPKGKWRVVSTTNCNVTPEKGSVGSHVRIDTKQGSSGRYSVAFEFIGEQTTDYRGIVTPAGKPVLFKWQKFEIGIDWNVQWFAWDRAKFEDPKAKMPRFEEVVSAAMLQNPIAQTEVAKLDFATGGSPFRDVPDNHFLTLAEGEFTVPKGKYEIGVTSDDGIRLFLDGKLIVDEWHWQGPTRFAKTFQLSGKHKLRAEHYEIDGYTALKVDVVPK
jgi:hypothetical protein